MGDLHKSESTASVVDYYSAYDEDGRLMPAFGQVEFVRTQSLLSRLLPADPAKILDVGGASGRYSCWLASLGYEMHLVDPVPKHIEQALSASARQSSHQIASCSLGDARDLQFDDSSFDAVLVMGPLYHLLERSDRVKALQEAYRVLKPGGVVCATAISRYASTVEGLGLGSFTNPEFLKIMHQDLTDGQHRNPTGKPEYFMDTFFHHSDELISETLEAGFNGAKLYAIESIGYLVQELDTLWEDEARKREILDILKMLEEEPTLMGASPHILIAGTKATI